MRYFGKEGVAARFDAYPGARHGFTNPDAGEYGVDRVRLWHRGGPEVLGTDAGVSGGGVRRVGGKAGQANTERRKRFETGSWAAASGRLRAW